MALHHLNLCSQTPTLHRGRLSVFLQDPPFCGHNQSACQVVLDIIHPNYAQVAACNAFLQLRINAVILSPAHSVSKRWRWWCHNDYLYTKLNSLPLIKLHHCITILYQINIWRDARQFMGFGCVQEWTISIWTLRYYDIWKQKVYFELYYWCALCEDTCIYHTTKTIIPKVKAAAYFTPTFRTKQNTFNYQIILSHGCDW